MRDRVAGFELTEAELAGHQNELRALQHLWVGLEFLNEQVHTLELLMLERMDPSKRQIVYGNHPLLADMPMELLTCFFHWYAVSACNFVRLVGWLRHECQPGSPAPRAYVETVLPEVLPWRNKIAAHFARADTRDSKAEQMMSVFPPIGFSDTRFTASPLMLLGIRRGRPSSSQAILPWSLTAVHEALRQRYLR